MADWLIAAYVINFILIIVLVCFERREPVVALAWVLGFTVFPMVGFIVFLFFGQGLKSYNRKKYQLKAQHDEEYSRMLHLQHDILEHTTDEKYTDIMRYLLNSNNSIYTEDNSVEIFTSAKDKFDRLIYDIEHAKYTINLLYFIIKDDTIGKKIIDLLTKKAKEGVEVRLLYDDIGSLFTPKKLFEPLKEAGGKVYQFFPVRLGSYLKINHRNHRKIVVIDGKVGYLGGMNIGDEYFGLKKPSPWRDTHMRIGGSAVYFLQERFAMDWLYSTKEDLSAEFGKFFAGVESDGDVGIQIASSGPDSKGEEIKCAMIKMINDAGKNILIQTPYFVPDKPFMESLIVAAKSGVDVEVMIPGIPDKKYVYYTTMSYVGELLNAGIKVYKYPGFIHSKTMTIDDSISTIGTTNIDIRSFQLHFEINAFVYDRHISEICHSIFDADKSKCEEITKEKYSKRGLLNIMKEGFYRLFSPIM